MRRLWLLLRVFFFTNAATQLNHWFDPLPHGGNLAPRWNPYDDQTGHLALVVSFLLAALVFTPANRGRSHRLLNALLNPRGTKEHEAASVAALLGSRGAAATLATAGERFRALPLPALTRDELANSKPDPALHQKTVATKLGDVDAFASHSWSDEGSAKFDKLHDWAGGQSRLVWLDKACIDQLDIEASLACLPVFLAGCKHLLVLAGRTYASRLWCVMELFVWTKMGGKREDIIVKLLDDSAHLVESLRRFDAAKAKCFLDKDRQHLWAVIEASFGTFAPFNSALRRIFAEQLGLKSHSCGSSSVRV